MVFFRDIRNIAGALGHIATSLNGIQNILHEINAGRVETMLGTRFPASVEKVAEIEEKWAIRANGGEPELFPVERRRGRARRTDLVKVSYMVNDHGFTQKQVNDMAKTLGIRKAVEGHHPAYFPADADRIVAELDRFQRKRQAENTE